MTKGYLGGVEGKLDFYFLDGVTGFGEGLGDLANDKTFRDLFCGESKNSIVLDGGVGISDIYHLRGLILKDKVSFDILRDLNGEINFWMG